MSAFIGLYYPDLQWEQARPQLADNEGVQKAYHGLTHAEASTPLAHLLHLATSARWHNDSAQAHKVYDHWASLNAQGAWHAETESDWLDMHCALAQVDALADFAVPSPSPLRTALLDHAPHAQSRLEEALALWQASVGKAQYLSHAESDQFALSLRWMHWGACLAALGAPNLVTLVQALYQHLIDQHVHPEGYLRPLVENKQDGTFERLFEGTRALTLTAVLLQGTGRDIWSYENRGVTVTTSVAYLLYYYFYPEKWRWQANLNADAVKARYHQRGAFFDLTDARVNLRNIHFLLAELRPLFDLTGGGHSSLLCASQAPTPPKKKGWRLFG